MTHNVQMYMMLIEEYNRVVEANDFITDKLNDYILNKKSGLVYYTVEIDGEIKNVSLNNYDSVSAGLSGKYEDFYEYRSGNTSIIVSPNKEKLKGFCGWINRLTH
jgi:hypothetical protein